VPKKTLCITIHPQVLALRCKVCGCIDMPTIGPSRLPHAGVALCGACGEFIKYVPKRECIDEEEEEE